ncbi:uncharacterized protein CANTADRAFT_8339 [Suhomyces tanzawaensis NRRL Y-17324]|uniref:Uncharacterized protein n=1 Tax=Suhomyces tanzawaensis NRRL Y-17324 TaxID=984487 RepID=A0A1E4SB40_9ASCO|nr:uncharacterized protein CANTADRAFT_8339 [Suhomyces tanzawaensis NRRL Y-17324]ODV76740.1 hypothetical protein CANTADRAFT_8339 [Suhomyces tanzawaensis NRRL Y-17324]
MLTPPTSGTTTDFPVLEVPVLLQIKQLHQLMEDHHALIDQRLEALQALGARMESLRPSTVLEDALPLGMAHYKLTDFLVKLERQLEPPKPPPHDAYSASPHDLKRNRRRNNGSAANDSFRYDHSPYQHTERDQSINNTYESLTSDRDASTPGEAVALLQTYLDSILNIIKPNLKNNFCEVVEATGELVAATPMNTVNENNMNELISLIESTIGAFTI